MIWTILWLVWIAAFFAIEVPALLNKQDGDTLSEHVWAWASIKQKGITLATAEIRFTCWISLAGGTFPDGRGF
jgi:hypothetical protein